MKRTILCGTIAVLVVLAGCAVGPKYVRPAVGSPPAYKEAGAEWKVGQPGDALPRGKWWEMFGDRELNTLEEKIDVGNQNIAAAAANFLAARAIVRQARSQYYPTMTGGVSFTSVRLAAPLAVGFPTGNTLMEYSLPLDASWEPDFWGRIRNIVKASSFAAQASAADLQNVRLGAHAELAIDYYELRSQDALKQLFDSTVASYREALELTRDLYRANLESDEAVAQAEAQLTAAQAQDTNLGILRAEYEHAIAVLIGESAPAFSLLPSAFQPAAPTIPVGIPSQLLERRPDIASAERAVAGANAQIGVAKAAFFPNITLSASGGFEALSAAKWFRWPSRFWSVGPSLAETIFDGGLRRAAVQQSQASYEQTVANYRQTVLTAFAQVEDNLASLRLLSQIIRQQETAIRAAKRNLEEALVRYRAGLDPYLNVVAAQTALLSQEQIEVGFKAQQVAASVQLIKALGGGWDSSRLPSPDALR